MDRRGLLRLFAGGAAAGATGGVSVSAAAAAIGVNAASATIEQIGENCSGAPGLSQFPWRVMNVMRAHRYAKARPVDQMPPHISGKRSWSPTYKASQFAREEAILEAFYQRMEAEEGFADRFLNAIIGEPK